jgi:hypothetical protein
MRRNDYWGVGGHAAIIAGVIAFVVFAVVFYIRWAHACETAGGQVHSVYIGQMTTINTSGQGVVSITSVPQYNTTCRLPTGEVIDP